MKSTQALLAQQRSLSWNMSRIKVSNNGMERLRKWENYFLLFGMEAKSCQYFPWSEQQPGYNIFREVPLNVHHWKTLFELRDRRTPGMIYFHHKREWIWWSRTNSIIALCKIFWSIVLMIHALKGTFCTGLAARTAGFGNCAKSKWCPWGSSTCQWWEKVAVAQIFLLKRFTRKHDLGMSCWRTGLYIRLLQMDNKIHTKKEALSLLGKQH